MQEEKKIVVLDAHQNKSNIIDNRCINTTLDTTFDQLSEILKGHCGPHSWFAMLTPEIGDMVNVPVFTKDGLNIIQAIKYLNCIQDEARRTVAYIGKHVEQGAGDGTTSSMILVTRVLKHLRKYVSANRVTYNQYTKDYQTFVAMVVEEMKKLAIITNNTTDKALISAVARQQTMTSSHGNVELAKLLETLFTTTTRSSWRHVEYLRETQETEVTYRLEVDRSDICFPASIFDGRMYNADSNTKFIQESGTFILCADTINSNSPVLGEVIAAIKKAVAEDTYLTILTPANFDRIIFAKLQDAIPPKSHGKIGIFLDQNTSLTDINLCAATAAIIGYRMQNVPEIITLENIKVEYYRERLSIFGIAKYDENGDLVGMHDITTVAGMYCHALSERIQALTRDGSHHARQARTIAIQLHNSVAHATSSRIVVGGRNYDHEAAVDVVEDAMKATRSSLTDGCVLGNFSTMRQALNGLLQRADTLLPSIKAMAEAFKAGIEYIESCVLEHAGYWGPVTLDDAHLQVPNGLKSLHVPPEHVVKEGKADEWRMKNIQRCIGGCIFDVIAEQFVTLADIETWNHVIVQPITTDIELLNRFGEVAIKFLFVNRIIVPNAVVANEPSTP